MDISWDDGGVDQRLFCPSAAASPEKNAKKYPHRDPGSVQQLHPENQVTDIAKKQQQHEPWCSV